MSSEKIYCKDCLKLTKGYIRCYECSIKNNIHYHNCEKCGIKTVKKSYKLCLIYFIINTCVHHRG